METIVQKLHPDIICLQELETTEENLKQMENYGYSLADYSNSFIKFSKIYGVATFYNPDTLSCTDSSTINLPRGVYELFLYILRILNGGNKSRTVLKTEFIAKINHKNISVYNTHLTLFGSNGVRLKQLNTTLKDIVMNQDKSVIIAGDFNYFPYDRKRLESIMNECGLLEATNDILFTYDRERIKHELIHRIGFALFPSARKLKLDYVFYRGLLNTKTERIDVDYSDHYPIIASFQI